REEHLIEMAEQLAAEAYKAQRSLSKPKGGRPRLTARDNLVDRVGVIYSRITDKKPARSENPETGEPTGPFVRFVCTILKSQRIPLKGKKHVISKAVRNAKNLR